MPNPYSLPTSEVNTSYSGDYSRILYPNERIRKWTIKARAINSNISKKYKGRVSKYETE